jgi:hypothetical protein
MKKSDGENGGEVRGKGLGREGHLSGRMRLPGNLWRVMWKEAQAVPANKQAPLFKHATEAEKVLHYLENLTLPDLIQQLISVVLNVILYTFKPTSQQQPTQKEEGDEDRKIKERRDPHTHTTPPLGVDLPPFIAAFDNLLRAIDAYWPEVYSKDKPIQVENLTSLWQEFQGLECMAAKATSLLQKMPGKMNIVSHLLSDEQVLIPDHLREDFSPIFFHDSEVIGADTKEYIIRCHASESNPTANRLYACISAHEAKVVTVFGSDE